MDSQLLGGLTPATFLKQYWQKQPLLVRQALPGFRDPLSPDELAGLALEPGIKARLVRTRQRRQPWAVEHGPFTAAQLASLPAADWTLLVSRVNEYVGAAAALLDHFAFIPHWRCEDLMVSFAPPGGGVGPHVDSYDVFLLQGQGRRRWQIARTPEPALVPGAGLKVLQRFTPEDEWILEPGDMLYVPPGVAHHGVALDNCLTYSVGFRAPAVAGLRREFYNLPDALLGGLTHAELYSDPHLAPTTAPGEIGPDAVRRLRALLAGPLDDPEVLGRWFGALLTKPEEAAAPRRRRAPSVAVLTEQLKADRGFWRNDDVRLAYLAPQGKALHVFVGGEELNVDAALQPLLATLCAKRSQSGKALLAALPKRPAARQAGIALLARLIAAGALGKP